MCNTAPSDCYLVDYGTNHFNCTSLCGSGSGPCDLTTSNCWDGPSAVPGPSPEAKFSDTMALGVAVGLLAAGGAALALCCRMTRRTPPHRDDAAAATTREMQRPATEMVESPLGRDDAATAAVDEPPPPAFRISEPAVPVRGSYGGSEVLWPGAADGPPPPPVIISGTVVDAEPAGFGVPVVVTGTVVDAEEGGGGRRGGGVVAAD